MPEKPGSYQFYDESHHIIYVGKAKRLKTRVSSYFHKEVDRFKTKVLVSRIHDISYTVVNTEEDALLLENSLIKKYTMQDYINKSFFALLVFTLQCSPKRRKNLPHHLYNKRISAEDIQNKNDKQTFRHLLWPIQQHFKYECSA